MYAAPEWVMTAVQPWSDLFSGSTAVATGVEFLHLASLLVAGGFALSYDRAALRLSDRIVADRSEFVTELSAIHLPVMLALCIVVLSGLALMFADLETTVSSRVFWIKMAGFVLLLVNGFMIQVIGGRLRFHSRDPRVWRSLRHASMRSMALWITLMFMGVLLRNAG